jgi:oxaloacetate decarboxylase alpha subunit
MWICFPKQAEDFLKSRKENREKIVKYTIEEA